MKQKILNGCLIVLILFAFLVELYWLGGGTIESLVDGSYRSDYKVITRVDEYGKR